MTTDALAAAATPPAAPSTTPPAAGPAPSAAVARARATAVEQGLVLPCTRRALLRRAGLGTAVLGSAGVLAACGGTSETTAGTSGDDGSSAAGGSGSAVAASEVPEGSAVVVQAGGQEVVLAQPTAGQYVAFSAVCTHAGGIVQADSGTQVKCPLHGSVFDAGDGGAVLEGPATKPLEALTVTVSGDQLTIA